MPLSLWLGSTAEGGPLVGADAVIFFVVVDMAIVNSTELLLRRRRWCGIRSCWAMVWHV